MLLYDKNLNEIGQLTFQKRLNTSSYLTIKQAYLQTSNFTKTNSDDQNLTNKNTTMAPLDTNPSGTFASNNKTSAPSDSSNQSSAPSNSSNQPSAPSDSNNQSSANN